MKPFGLTRGLEGSLAKHENVKQYYARVNAPVEKTISFEPKVFESKTAAITRMIDEVVKPIAQKAYEQQERLKGFDNMVGVWSSTRKTNQELNKEKDYYEEVLRQTAEGKISIGQLNAWLIQVGVKKPEKSLKNEPKRAGRSHDRGKDFGPSL
jgi:hypothetical protein